MSAPPPGCAGHLGVSAELRALAHAVLDRLEPAVGRLRDQPPSPAAGPSAPPCAICPVCALVAVLRGERPELVARLAEHLGELIGLARDVLAEPASPPPPERTASGSSKRVQRIPVERVGAGG